MSIRHNTAAATSVDASALFASCVRKDALALDRLLAPFGRQQQPILDACGCSTLHAALAIEHVMLGKAFSSGHAPRDFFPPLTPRSRQRGFWDASPVEPSTPWLLARAAPFVDTTLRKLLEHLHPSEVNATCQRSGGMTPLHAAAEHDNAAAIQVLVRAGAHVDATDARGRTALMSAMRWGSTAAADALVQLGADLTRRCDRGRTAADLAQMRGNAMLRQLQLVGNDGDDQKAAAEVEECELPVEPLADMTPARLLRDFVELGRPVLLRANAAVASDAHETASRLGTCMASRIATPTTIPYPRVYLAEAAAREQGTAEEGVPFARYVQGGESMNDPATGVPRYIFEGALCLDEGVQGAPPPGGDGGVLGCVDELQAWRLPAGLQPPGMRRGGACVAMQLGVGNTGSGSPAHLHSTAFNALFNGTKRWALLPPRRASMSTVPAQRWFASELPRLREAHGALECTQRPGDVLVVPELWGHATLVKEGPAMAVALEQGSLRTDAERRVGWGPLQVDRFNPFDRGGNGCAASARGACKGIECVSSSLACE